jgi:hypothetical protein
MKRRAPKIPPRKLIFLGCEGHSEKGYGALLERYGKETPECHIHIRSEVLQPGAGDPHALVLKAIKTIKDIEKKREKFQIKAILLDKGSQQKNDTAQRAANEAEILLIWQDPDHESFLLHHLNGCKNLKPSKDKTMETIQNHWPEYKKGMNAMQLAGRIALSDMRNACTVERDLRIFLIKIGLTQE